MAWALTSDWTGRSSSVSGSPIRPFAIMAGDAPAIWSLGGRFATLASGSTTDGHLDLLEATAWRSTEPPLHVHEREDEAWYVLEGQLTFQVGSETFVAGTGAFAFAPRGLPHAFTVDVEPTRVLVLALPSGFAGFANEAGEAAEADGSIPDLTIDPSQLGPIAARYGIEIVGPPIRVARGELPR